MTIQSGQTHRATAARQRCGQQIPDTIRTIRLKVISIDRFPFSPRGCLWSEKPLHLVEPSL